MARVVVLPTEPVMPMTLPAIRWRESCASFVNASRVFSTWSVGRCRGSLPGNESVMTAEAACALTV